VTISQKRTNSANVSRNADIAFEPLDLPRQPVEAPGKGGLTAPPAGGCATRARRRARGCLPRPCAVSGQFGVYFSSVPFLFVVLARHRHCCQKTNRGLHRRFSQVIWAADTLAMTNWEARARLALEHISRWRDWDKGAATRGAGSSTTGVDLEAIGLSGHSRGGESVRTPTRDNVQARDAAQRDSSPRRSCPRRARTLA
jgi:hypothetical protein